MEGSSLSILVKISALWGEVDNGDPEKNWPLKVLAVLVLEDGRLIQISKLVLPLSDFILFLLLTYKPGAVAQFE